MKSTIFENMLGHFSTMKESVRAVMDGVGQQEGVIYLPAF
jgi:hypothetical protein